QPKPFTACAANAPSSARSFNPQPLPDFEVNPPSSAKPSSSAKASDFAKACMLNCSIEPHRLSSLVDVFNIG
ncbi:MAG TPA: hypothetical protein VGO21_05360, partial [Candidatus Paceibacterota bacterium]|nr:hypothetical protein [Candidatus Paceibacterota bacterium]